MGKVIFDTSMSLDGFMTASNRRPEEPMGDGGQLLHEWAFGEDERDRESYSRMPSKLWERSSPAERPTTTRLRGGGRTGRRAPLVVRCSSSPTTRPPRAP